ncbi:MULTISPECIES: SRPBCC family protein [Salimicrobium]|uniref:Ligand-binding SRPBCC domain-containing protein n=2 Tax=Salimicrobium TaxID=351195 RepID=A0ABY1KZQ8_9BACI|nr:MULTISPECIES: SRPBCC family protein [Salimicrobium]SDY08873.1 Ligand-binding SRPBCC domain-containing protein [Salimicrobium album]SIS98392.1 Ligand-binding SRPBCC domain-containing protein [Salimicrobium salexigens]
MKIYKIERTQQLPISLSEAWSFFSSAGNLSRITPPWMKFEVTGELPEHMYPGMIATYHLQPVLGITLSWMTEITHVEENKMFVDEQRHGPFQFWHHQHHFKKVENGVEMTDIVHYALPFSKAGRIAHRLSIRKKLEEIFRYRHQKVEEMFKDI